VAGLFANNSRPPSAKVKKTWNSILILPYICMKHRSIKQKDLYLKLAGVFFQDAHFSVDIFGARYTQKFEKKNERWILGNISNELS